MRRLLAGLLCASACVGVLAAAEGIVPGAPVATAAAATTTTAPRVITIEMLGIRFKPDVVKVRAGDPIRFRFRNTSNLLHDALIGDEAVQKAFEKSSGKGVLPGMGQAAGDGYVAVAPGATKTLDHTFVKAGRTIIGCHQPGHYASGMKMTVIIEPRSAIG